MLLPTVFALAVPASFVHAVEARIAAEHLHVVSSTAELEVIAGKIKIHVHLHALEGKASYPPPPGKF